MDAIERYNQARDREQHAFELSRLGEAVRNVQNWRARYDATRAPSAELVASLAAEYAFGAQMPAFYAGRALGIW